MVKRIFDLILSALGLILLSPVFALLALAVLVADGVPVVFRQERVGRNGRRFILFKFRTMTVDADKRGLSVTASDDPRVTPMGRFLRKHKLDELPQLWNVLVGDMSLVGPRPEVPRYVERYTADQQRVLTLKPGITDPATLAFRNEEAILRRLREPGATALAANGPVPGPSGRETRAGAGGDASNPGLPGMSNGGSPPQTEDEIEAFYLDHCLPRKIAMSLEYAEKANCWEDLKIILKTVRPTWVRLNRSVAAGGSGLRDLRVTGAKDSHTKPGGETTVLAAGNGKPDHASTNLIGGPGSKILRRTLFAILTFGALFICRWLAYQLRFDFVVSAEYQVQLSNHWWWVVLLQMGWLLIFGQFSGIFKYFSLPELRSLAYAMSFSGLSLYGLRYLEIGFSPPRGVILMQCLLGFLAVGGMRLGWRLLNERYFSRKRHRCFDERKVAIIGAGDAGASLVRELHAQPNLGLLPVAFFDDNPQKWGFHIHGIPVIGSPEQIPRYLARLHLEEVVIAMPSAAPRRLGEVVSLLQKARLKYVTVPGIEQLTSGACSISQLRPVRIEDLLGREPVDLRMKAIADVLKHRTVMVTGAGGSIGGELCRQIAAFGPQRLLLVEQSEVQLFQIEQDLIRLGHGKMILPVIADILDRPRMRGVLESHAPEVLFHAAAHKHVAMMESQPSEAIKNNALGTLTLAELAVEYGVERFVMISTDKAVNPTSVMGASKRLAEVFLQAYAREHGARTRFVAVRFGNVLGSSGSVVPIFERQIAAGGPVTVTHPEVVRFFMTIPEAVGLVLQSCAQGDGGEIFVLDMGKPVKIAELAAQMIKLSGLEPGRDIEIRFTGLKPGEKLYEELHHLRANCTETAHPRIKRLTREPRSLAKVRQELNWLKSHLDQAGPDELKRMLKLILPEYTPYLGKQGRDGPARVKRFRHSRHCPRATGPTHKVKPNNHCRFCDSFRLCAWQYCWVDAEMPDAREGDSPTYELGRSSPADCVDSKAEG